MLCFVGGFPPMQLAFRFAGLVNREVEYVSISRDTTESDEEHSGSEDDY